MWKVIGQRRFCMTAKFFALVYSKFGHAYPASMMCECPPRKGRKARVSSSSSGLQGQREGERGEGQRQRGVAWWHWWRRRWTWGSRTRESTPLGPLPLPHACKVKQAAPLPLPICHPMVSLVWYTAGVAMWPPFASSSRFRSGAVGRAPRPSH